jgi:DNA polymerase (family 10)
MDNSEIARVFGRIADLMEIKGENRYKILAYRRASEIIPTFPERLEELSLKELVALQGIGQALAEKIQELNATSRLAFLEKLENEVPPTLVDLLAVPDVGPKKVALFWKEAGVTTLAELEEAAGAGKLRALPGMGEKSEARILTGIQSLRTALKRLPIHEVSPLANEWLARLKTCPAIRRLAVAGSLRRMRATIGDLDLVGSTASFREAMDFYLTQPGIQEVVSRGEYKSSVRLVGGLNMQLWLQPDERFGSLLQFVTGSKAHNVRLREFALKQGLSLSERGFVGQDLKETLCAEEEDVYRRLGLPFIPPELREDLGEIEAAVAGALPALPADGDLRADLHLDGSGWRGNGRLLELGRAASAIGLHTICFVLPLPAGPPRPDVTESAGFLEALSQARVELSGIRVLSGLEIEVTSVSDLVIDGKISASFDLATAHFNVTGSSTSADLTSLALKAVELAPVRVFSIQTEDVTYAAQIAGMDWGSILQNAGDRALALQINGQELHLGPDEAVLKLAARHGVPLSVTSRATSTAQLADGRFALGFARRAWLTADSILSAWDYQRLAAWLERA